MNSKDNDNKDSKDGKDIKLCPFCSGPLGSERTDKFDNKLTIRDLSQAKVFLTESNIIIITLIFLFIMFQLIIYPLIIYYIDNKTDRAKSAVNKKVNINSRLQTGFKSENSLSRPVTGKLIVKENIEDVFSKHYKTESNINPIDDFFASRNNLTYKFKDNNDKFKTPIELAKNNYSYNNLIFGKNKDKIILETSKNKLATEETKKNQSITKNRISTEETQLLDNKIKYTNNLLLHRTRLNVDRHNLSKNMFKVKQRVMESTYKRANKINNKLEINNSDNHDKISSHLDGLIRSFEKQYN